MATPHEAARAAELHADELASYPNVVGIGTRPVTDKQRAGRRGVTQAAAGQGGSDHAVAVYVSQTVPGEQLARDARLPEHVDLPVRDGVRQVPVVVIETGTIAPEETSGDAHQHFTKE